MVDTIQVERFDLLESPLESKLGSAFDDYEQINHEFGIDWLRNLASTALPGNERGYIFVARFSATEFIACPARLDKRNAEAHALSNFYSSLYSPIVMSSRPLPLYIALFKHLAEEEGVNCITLSPFDAQSIALEDIQLALLKSGWKGIHLWTCFTNWTHQLTSNNYQNYYSALPSKLRNTIRRKTGKFMRERHSTLRLICGTEEVESGIEEFQWVYQRSWKKREPYPDFIPGLLRLAAKRGWLRLGVAYSDAKPVAAQIWIVANGTAYIFKLAYDEEYKQFSPGTILTAYLMEHVISRDQVDTIDYMTGGDAHKEDWMSEHRERIGVAAYNPRKLKGLLAYISHWTKGHIKTIFPST